MKLATFDEALFSFKSYAGAVLALYLALRFALPRPFWAMMTAYIVINPFSGAVRSKGVYRVLGSVMGAAVAVTLVPQFANAPVLLSLALALWVGTCLYVSLLDRTPRSYVFMLAGYTAALIGFPSVADPASIFDTAVARVEEVSLGIVCATLVHSLLLPKSVGSIVSARLNNAVRDVEQWMHDALFDADLQKGRRDRRRLAADITELRLMSTHLPFDTSHLRWKSVAIRAMQERMATIVPLLAAIEDRLRALRRLDGDSLAPPWAGLLEQIGIWAGGDDGRTRPQWRQLRRQIAAVTPRIGPTSSWSQILQLSLAMKLTALIDAHEDSRTLRRHIDDDVHKTLPRKLRPQIISSFQVLHRDHRLALISAAAAVVAIGLGCAFWILTAWTGGAMAVTMVAIFSCFFATQNDPVPALKMFFHYTLLSVPVSALYLLVLLPAVHHFETFVLVTAPAFLLMGVYVARPGTVVPAMAMILGVAGMFALQDTGVADIVSLLNGSMAQLWGIAVAAICTRLLRSVSAEWTARRVRHAGWEDLARLATAQAAPAAHLVSARMLDRIGLLTSGLALTGEQQDRVAVDALNDLRVGLNVAHLLRSKAALERNGIALHPVLDDLSRYFGRRRHKAAPAEAAMLDRLDDTLRAVGGIPASSTQRRTTAALAGIRRDLFPDAPPYCPATHSHGGT